jgi:hypothetical protein
VTTPLVLLFYPERLRDGRFAHVEEGSTAGQLSADNESDGVFKSRFSMVLDKLEHLPAAMTFAQLIKVPSFGSTTTTLASDHGSIEKVPTDTKESPTGSTADALAVMPLPRHRQTSIDTLRLIELSDRTSGMLKAHSADMLMHQDTVLSVMRTFGKLNHLAVSTSLVVVPEEEFASNVATHARNTGSQMIVLPWSLAPMAAQEVAAANPFDTLFRRNSSTNDASSHAYSHVIRSIFANSPTDVALFLDRGLSSKDDSSPHLFLPFFGGPDDRLALSLVVQFCRNTAISATVIRVHKTETSQANDIAGDGQLAYGNVSATF